MSSIWLYDERDLSEIIHSDVWLLKLCNMTPWFLFAENCHVTCIGLSLETLNHNRNFFWNDYQMNLYLLCLKFSSTLLLHTSPGDRRLIEVNAFLAPLVTFWLEPPSFMWARYTGKMRTDAIRCDNLVHHREWSRTVRVAFTKKGVDNIFD